MKSTWTKTEINLIKKGKVPDGRTVAQCIQQSSNMGIPWKKDDSWTRDEIKMLKDGIAPPKKTHGQIRKYCRKNGIALPDGVAPMDGPGRKQVYWTDDELNLLKQDIIPDGKTYNQCVYACRMYLNKGFRPKNTPQREKIAERGKVFYELWRDGKKQQDIAEEYGLTRQRVHQLITKYLESTKEE